MVDKIKEHWWEQFQYQCPRCKHYLSFYLQREGNKYYYKKCNKCGFKRRSEIVFADYKMKDGKTFLKRNGWKSYREVELKNFGDYLRVVEVQNKLWI